MAVKDGYSTIVSLKLLVQGKTLPLSHIGPSGMIVSGQCEPLPPGDGELRITIDELRTKRRVYLPQGIPGPGQWIPFSETPF